jgi:hypothetical protein
MDCKQVSWQEFLAMFDPKVHEALKANREKPGVDGIAVLECHVMDSSRLGDKTGLIYGPDCTFKSIDVMKEQKAGIYITGLPSSASFPIAYTTDMPS